MPEETLAEIPNVGHGRASIRRDAVIILTIAGALIGFYALFKAVSLIAGLPFP
jgi:hypothetical protein